MSGGRILGQQSEIRPPDPPLYRRTSFHSAAVACSYRCRGLAMMIIMVLLLLLFFFFFAFFFVQTATAVALTNAAVRRRLAKVYRVLPSLMCHRFSM